MADKFEIDEELLRKLATILSDTGLTEIEYEVDGQRIRVARSLPGAGAAHYTIGPAGTKAPDSTHGTASAASAQSAEAPGTISAPMVGTVYTAPEPGKPPFVKVGDSVKEGQTLLIIEAMKVMNTLPSPRAGTVTEVLVSDGQPVEYGEPLLVIE